MDDQKKSVKNVTDGQHPHWENHWNSHSELWNEPPSEVAVRAFQQFQTDGKSIILELGGGMGRDTIFFAQNGIQVYVVEYTKVSVETIKRKAESLNLTRSVHVLQHDVRKPLPFDPNFFDGCYSHMLYCMAFNKKELEFLSEEVNRVLKNKGLNIFTVRNTNDPLYGTSKQKDGDLYEVQGFILHFFDKEK
ncbi:class I SAM-dependent methyltransferase, partial [Ammoniphilus sp. 3BR4]|uniref:class I SAM-dependent methyltransferase n=1 Tax=Ammoniphilus sp. 3BR4 TaxID=3158265 RepID=UPI003466B25B